MACPQAQQAKRGSGAMSFVNGGLIVGVFISFVYIGPESNPRPTDYKSVGLAGLVLVFGWCRGAVAYVGQWRRENGLQRVW